MYRMNSLWNPLIEHTCKYSLVGRDMIFFVIRVLDNDSKDRFPLGRIFRAERNFSLSCDFSSGTNGPIPY